MLLAKYIQIAYYNDEGESCIVFTLDTFAREPPRKHWSQLTQPGLLVTRSLAIVNSAIRMLSVCSSRQDSAALPVAVQDGGRGAAPSSRHTLMNYPIWALTAPLSRVQVISLRGLWIPRRLVIT